MSPLYKQVISTMIYEPELIAVLSRYTIDCSGDQLAEKGVELLTNSALYYVNHGVHQWYDFAKTQLPNIKHLVWFLRGTDISIEATRYITRNHPEAIYLKEMYNSTSIDKSLLQEYAEDVKRNVLGFRTDYVVEPN